MYSKVLHCGRQAVEHSQLPGSSEERTSRTGESASSQSDAGDHHSAGGVHPARIVQTTQVTKASLGSAGNTNKGLTRSVEGANGTGWNRFYHDRFQGTSDFRSPCRWSAARAHSRQGDFVCRRPIQCLSSKHFHRDKTNSSCPILGSVDYAGDC